MSFPLPLGRGQGEGSRIPPVISMSYAFDRVIERRSTASNKWRKYPADVLPLWVADMDFA